MGLRYMTLPLCLFGSHCGALCPEMQVLLGDSQFLDVPLKGFSDRNGNPGSTAWHLPCKLVDIAIRVVAQFNHVCRSTRLVLSRYSARLLGHCSDGMMQHLGGCGRHSRKESRVSRMLSSRLVLMISRCRKVVIQEQSCAGMHERERTLEAESKERC